MTLAVLGTEATRSCYWLPENYPHLCSPFSPCITLQWTYRDGHLVNLPWALLVTGDVIMIRPGQQAPGHCIPFEVRDFSITNISQQYCDFEVSPHNLSLRGAWFES